MGERESKRVRKKNGPAYEEANISRWSEMKKNKK